VLTLRDSVGVPLIVFSRQDDNVVAVNNILRQASHPVHCTRVGRLNDLADALEKNAPELVILFDEEPNADLAAVSEQLANINPAPPLLLVRSRITEQSIADAMECGARDVVSLTHQNRFQAVVTRELRAYRLQVTLDRVLSSANQYKQELKTLMQGSAEAIADVQEGIIIAANPTWLELFGYESEEELITTPFMDICSDADHPILKGAVIACLRGKWDDTTLKISGCRADTSELQLEIKLERVTVDGEPTVRVIVPGEPHIGDNTAQMLEQAIYKDPATGFYHRHFFVEKIKARINIPLKDGVRALAYIRPDNFARVHDDIGMLATEVLLTQLAGLMREFMQPGDLYGRFGGTMFIVLLERGNMSDVEAWAEQLRSAVEKRVFEVDDQSTSLTSTVGLCEVDPDNLTIAELLAQVEDACRAGRRDGGNRVQLTENTSATQVMRAADAIWVPRLRTALMQNRLRLVHQPVMSLRDDMEGVYDTRVQMLDEDDNVILASEFIAAAERANMIKNVDRWVIGASFSFCAAKQPTMVFVRLSSDSVTDRSLLDWLAARLQVTRINPAQICFQVSEEVASQHLKQTKAVAEQLKAAEFLFAIDHMGNGRDPEQLLNHIPMDFMKIDGSLMQGLHLTPAIQQAVGALASLANSRGIKTIAEQVEDANTIAVLWQLGIPLIQGHYSRMRGVVLEDTQTVRGLGSG
jgi:diguanylate cyclase (GGDEF)-like protein